MAERVEAALALFDEARAHIEESGRSWELEWQRSRRSTEFNESDLLRETAWVVLCSGFRESIVRRVFDQFSLCFCDWESASEIVANEAACRLTALLLINNSRKVDAIIAVARRVEEWGYENLNHAIMSDPIAQFRAFPFIGPVTCWHLAKNLGFEVAKPDRHLSRLSLAFGFRDAHHLCAAIAEAAGESVDVVDIVLWRYLASTQRGKHSGWNAKWQRLQH